MSEPDKKVVVRRPWIAPEISEIDVRETFAAPNTGDDVGSNPYVDCQRS